MNSNNQNSNFEYPPKSQLNILLEHYQTGRFEDAENVAKKLTQKFPKDIFAWKVPYTGTLINSGLISSRYQASAGGGGSGLIYA